jgi:hypothetical protein
VEVAILQLIKSTRTNKDGQYRIEKVPIGTYALTARRLGYVPWRDSIVLTADENYRRDILLRPSTVTLDSVKVTERYNDPLMDEFEEHRRLGFGHFITSDELRKMEGTRMSTVLSRVPGLAMIPGTGGEAWILSKRMPPSMGGCTPSDVPRPGGKVYTPSKGEANRGVRCACYAQVYLDHTLMNGGMPTDPFNVNEIPVSQIEAIEFYAGPSQTPGKYAKLGSPCGVYVIHTRRPDDSD